MKLKLTATVDGTLKIKSASSAISAQHEDVTFTLTSDASKRVTAASVAITLTEEESRRCKSLVSHPAEGDRLDVECPPDLYASAIRHLQALESNLSFGYVSAAVTRIQWDEPTLDLIPENAEEEALINAWSIRVQQSYPELPAMMLEEEFQTMVEGAPAYEELVVSKAFYREGKNEFRKRRYVQAFYNFYFVIEGLFADGRFKETEVMRVFRDSKELQAATKITLATLAKDAKQWSRMQGALGDRGFALDSEGMWRFLFRTRGELHHYFRGSSRQHGTPFANDKFETSALLALLLARQCVMVRIVVINGGSLQV